MRLRVLITKHKTLLLYLIAGGLTTLVNYVLYFLIRYWQGAEFDLSALLSEKSGDAAAFTVANTLAVVGAVIFAYPVNKLMVFQSKCQSKRALLREIAAFFASRSIVMLFEVGAGTVLVSLLSLPELPSKLAVTVFVVLFNYLLSVTVIFKKKKPSDPL